MKNIIKKNDNDIFEILFYDLFKSYRINIKPIYQFVYDDFFKHLIADTNNYILKNYNKEHHIDLIEYKKGIFKGLFYKHYSNSKWFYKILNPENNKEVIKEIRNRKLKKIENGSR